MGKRLGNAMGDWEFIRAAQIEARECETSYDVAIQRVIELDERRSVVRMRLTAHEVAPEGAQAPLCAYETEWPNARVQSFTACLFQAHVQLTRLVEDSRRDEALVGVSRQSSL